ncbi:MAG: hypothetical protein AAF497_06610 [Planctomycetota bacterium]
MTSSEHQQRLDEVDERLTDALLEFHLGEETQRRCAELVDGAIGQIRSQRDSFKTDEQPVLNSNEFKTRRRKIIYGLSALSGVAATVLLAVTIFLLSSPKSAAARVQEALQTTLSSGPRKYDASFTYSGPIRGEFESKGGCYLDGSKRFVFQIPSPMGIESRMWTLGSNGEQLWAVLPSGLQWIGEGDQLQSWWNDRGLGDVPILHVEAVLESFGQTYELKLVDEEGAGHAIEGTSTESSPERWPDAIRLVIDQQTGFASEIRMQWDSGRLRRINLEWDRDAIVEPEFFDSQQHARKSKDNPTGVER